MGLIFNRREKKEKQQSEHPAAWWSPYFAAAKLLSKQAVGLNSMIIFCELEKINSAERETNTWIKTTTIQDKPSLSHEKNHTQILRTKMALHFLCETNSGVKFPGIKHFLCERNVSQLKANITSQRFRKLRGETVPHTKKQSGTGKQQGFWTKDKQTWAFTRPCYLADVTQQSTPMNDPSLLSFERRSALRNFSGRNFSS